MLHIKIIKFVAEEFISSSSFKNENAKKMTIYLQITEFISGQT